MSPEELEAWFQRHREPAIPLDRIPDRDALADLITCDRAIVWPNSAGVLYAASTVCKTSYAKRRPLDDRRRLAVETDVAMEYGPLDQMPSQSSDAVDPGFLASIAELSGRLVLDWERIGGRSVPWPVFIGLGCQPWPPRGTTIVKGRGGSMRLKRADAGEPCGVCGGRPLGPVAYCAACDRWGLDHLLKREARPRRAVKVKVEVKTIKFAPRGRKEKAG